LKQQIHALLDCARLKHNAEVNHVVERRNPSRRKNNLTVNFSGVD